METATTTPRTATSAAPADTTAPADAMDPGDIRQRGRVGIGGLWVPIITPFTATGDLDGGSLAALASRVLHDGATGLVALGTTGEPATLTAGERRRVVETCDAICRELGSGLIVGAGTNSTHGTIEEIDRLTSGTNATAVLVVVPYYTRPSPEAIVEHFQLVADASARPVVAYNVPYRTGRGLTAAHLLALAEHPNIVGVKQAVGALDADTLELLAAAPPGFAVLAGDDAFIAPTVLMGGTGAIAAAGHVCTRHFADLIDAAIADDVALCRSLSAALAPVVTLGFAEPNPAVWKATLARLGEIACDGLRRPLTAASLDAVEAHVAAVDQAVREILMSPEVLRSRSLTNRRGVSLEPAAG